MVLAIITEIFTSHATRYYNRNSYTHNDLARLSYRINKNKKNVLTRQLLNSTLASGLRIVFPK